MKKLILIACALAGLVGSSIARDFLGYHNVRFVADPRDPSISLVYDDQGYRGFIAGTVFFDSRGRGRIARKRLKQFLAELRGLSLESGQQCAIDGVEKVRLFILGNVMRPEELPNWDAAGGLN